MRKTLAPLDAVPKSYDEAIRVLAVAHSSGPDEIEIFSIPDPTGQVVRLIEVSESFPEGGVERPVLPSGVERIVPVFPMGQARDFPFRSEIAQVTPAEWELLLKGDLKLNRNWGDLNCAQRVVDGQ